MPHPPHTCSNHGSLGVQYAPCGAGLWADNTATGGAFGHVLASSPTAFVLQPRSQRDVQAYTSSEPLVLDIKTWVQEEGGTQRTWKQACWPWG